MRGLLVIIACTLIPLALMLLIVFMKVKKIKDNDSSLNTRGKSTQELLPFKSIADNVIDLGDYNYRAIIEVSSINYDLKTDEEKDIIELNYNRFLNSLTHPISIFIITKQIDQSKILDEIKADYENMKQNYPVGYDNVYDLIDKYHKCMSNIHNYTNNNLIKKKYVIVPYNEVLNFNHLSNNEKREECIKQLMNRSEVICSGLRGIGSLTAKILGTDEILELLFSYYHREEAPREEAIKNSEFTTLIVNNPNLKASKASPSSLLDAILCETQHKLKSEINEFKKDETINLRNVNIAIKTINNLRAKLKELNQERGE